MPESKGLSIPKFNSVEEEMDFWDEHDIRQFPSEPAKDIILAIKPERKKKVTLWMEPSLIAQLKRIASIHDLGYQTLMRGLIKRTLSDNSQ